MPGSGDLKRAKRALRASVLAARDAIPHPERAAMSQRIAERVAALPELAGVGLVLAYWPFGSEVDPRPFLAGLAGVRLALPRVTGSMIVPVSFRSGDALRTSTFGPVEPVLGEPLDPATIGFVLVPGVAFDRAGGRVGYGGGYYDRFLPALAPGTPTVGAAFSLQVVDAVPAGPSDLRVDLVVTEDEVIRPS